MKKILLILLILMTFLFVTSCDKKEADNNESSSSLNEDTSTQGSLNDEKAPLNHEDLYQVINLGDDFWVTENILSKRIYKSYDELTSEIDESILKANNVSEELFNENYILYLNATNLSDAFRYGFSAFLVGYSDLVYEDGAIYMNVYGENSGELFIDVISYHHHLVVIPKDEIPENINEENPYLRFTYITFDTRPLNSFYMP